MKIVLTVIKKELLDTLRDKRTLISAILLPMLLIPVLMFGVTKMQSSLIKKEQTKDIKIALFQAPENFAYYFQEDNIEIVSGLDLEAAKTAIGNDSLDAVLEFEPDFQQKVDQMKTGTINLNYKTTEMMLFNRISAKVEAYKATVLQERVKQLNITSEAINPVVIQKTDMASSKERLGKMFGGILPYMFIIMCFFGCMYPALDLITGEKEKGTIETLLTVPASRFKILLGKVLTIALVGLFSALMIIFGLFISLKLFPDIPAEFLTAINGVISVNFLLMMFAMLIPLSIFFAGILSALVIRANSFKEAQSIVTPLSFVVLIPAMMAMLPGIELNWKTVWIPILNIALATKEIIAETIQMEHFIVIVISLVIIALLSVFFSHTQFSKESMVLK